MWKQLQMTKFDALVRICTNIVFAVDFRKGAEKLQFVRDAAALENRIAPFTSRIRVPKPLLTALTEWKA
jgi:hypothetical protein